MDELIDFVRRCLDDDERVALGAIPGPWESTWWGVQTAYDFDRPGYIHHGERVTIARNSGTVGNREAEIRNMEHVARWDPPRVLALTRALRTAIDEFSWEARELAIIMTLAEALYAGREGWREEWAL